MSDTVAVEIPKEILVAARMSPDDMRVELAVALYQQRRISLGKACELARMDRWSFQQLLGSRKIPPHYDVEEYEQDKATLRELGLLP